MELRHKTMAHAFASYKLQGIIRVPGDKSISHRAILLAALARGTTKITGLLLADDVLATMRAVELLGAQLTVTPEGAHIVTGTGNGAMIDPVDNLDLGNSGTGARLLMGLVVGQGLTARFIGDESLSRRPMGRVIGPLQDMGAVIAEHAPNMTLPIRLFGTVPAMALDYRLPVASAQVKSALLLAGLGAPGTTIIREATPTRDHTEKMLSHFGVPVTMFNDENGARAIEITGPAELLAADLTVPGDISSAAFPLVAGLICPDSELTITGVGLNPLRTGLLSCLDEMGGDIEITNRHLVGGEEVGDLTVRSSDLRAVTVPADRAARMIDEYPILAVACSVAQGTSRFIGVGELRVKESDRLNAMAHGLAANGVAVQVEGDDMVITGQPRPKGGACVKAQLDHRIAMAFLIMGLVSEDGISVDDATATATSFPNFTALMRSLGAQLTESEL